MRRRINIWPFHPRQSTLQGFADRQLDAGGTRRITHHLKTCARCRTNLDQLRKSWELFLALVDAASTTQGQALREGLANLKTRIQFLRPLLPADSESTFSLQEQGQLRRQMVYELGIYLGPRLASALIEPLNKSESGSQKSLEEAEEMLGSFFGERAASKIMDRLLQVGQTSSDSISETELAQNLV